ncbi:uncharacterized mitochondrial protein AtMg00810-like [Rosa chinensis]|uniref:uncharacterized mitochondrial protein AtMg00810-like n=1 Tax=Rosa chinensis TaxID=74649 RepID=UPI000D08F432|nr:uncharacterized mitochondrial protein AtMg00810-like [Rosa chinensis]
MESEFEMSMCGELTFFLGLQVKQLNTGLFLSQTKYAENLIKKFGLESKKVVNNSMSTTTKLGEDKDGKSVDPTLYRSMIGSLLYLTASRPDISYSVGVCARFQANPKESHLEAVRRILRYILGTISCGIFYTLILMWRLQATQMLTGEVTLRIERPPQEGVSLLETT